MKSLFIVLFALSYHFPVFSQTGIIRVKKEKTISNKNVGAITISAFDQKTKIPLLDTFLIIVDNTDRTMLQPNNKGCVTLKYAQPGTHQIWVKVRNYEGLILSGIIVIEGKTTFLDYPMQSFADIKVENEKKRK